MLPRSKAEGGFTLFELLIVVATIGIIAAISIPKVLEARQAGHETNAAAFLRMVNQEQTLFQARNGRFATMEELIEFKYVDDPEVASYQIVLVVAPDNQSWMAIATPIVRPELMRHFWVDLSGVVRYAVGVAADGNSTPL